MNYSQLHKHIDHEIAERAVDILRWNAALPGERIKVTFEHGVATLSGDVDWECQKTRAESIVRLLDGVAGVVNAITVTHGARPGMIHDKVRTAIERSADLADDDIAVTVDGSRVTLSGLVHSPSERYVAENAAWSVPGVSQVVDNLSIG